MSAKVTEDSVMAELRCTLVSAKGGVPLAHLQRDYKSVIGQYIPFADLGHKSLENLLRAHPEVVRIVNKNGQQIVEAVVDENLGHIASLVSRQKTTKPTALKSKRGISIRRGGRNFRFSTRGRGRPSTFGHSSSAPYYSSAGSNSFGPSSRSSNVSRDSYSNSSHNVTRSSTERSSNVPQYSEPSAPGAGSAPMQKDLRTVLNEKRRNGVPPPSTTSRPKTPPAVRPQRETRHPPSRRPRIDMPPRFLRLLQQDLQRSSEPRVRRSPTPKSVEVELNKASDTSRASSRTGQMVPKSPATPEVEEEVWETVDTWTATDVETESLSQTYDIPLQTDSIPSQTDSIPSQTDGFLSFIPTDKSSEQKAESTNLHFDATAELSQATTSKEYIEIYARHHNLPIKFSTKMFKSSGFTTKLILGKEEYQTYPDFFKTAEIAEEEASLKAYNDVNKSEATSSSPTTLVGTPEEVRVFLRRIEEIVLDKPTGMFENNLWEEYTCKFLESMPLNWPLIVQESPIINIEDMSLKQFSKSTKANYLISIKKASRRSSGSATPSSEISLRELERTTSISSSEEESTPVKIPTLQLPNGNEWAVYITGVSGIISARLIDYDPEYLGLSADMEEYYKSEFHAPTEVQVNKLYAVFCSLETDIPIHRVLVTELKEDSWAGCYFVDEGKCFDIMQSDLQVLAPQFYTVPYQAIFLSLVGLDEYEELIAEEDMDVLLRKPLIAQVKKWETPDTDDFLPDDPAIHKLIYGVNMFDTNGDEDVDLNRSVIINMLRNYGSRSFRITASQCYLTHVTSKGNVFLRYLHPENSWIESEMERCAVMFESISLTSKDSLTVDTCYAVKLNDVWKRGMLKRKLTEGANEVEILFMDYGYCRVVPLKHISKFPYSKVLATLGPVAIKCKLFNALPFPEASWSSKATELVWEIAPPNEQLTVRVMVPGDSKSPPKVSLHKRVYVGDDSYIVSINERLFNTPQIFEFTESPDVSSSESSNDSEIIPPPVENRISPVENSISPVETVSSEIRIPHLKVGNDLSKPLTNGNTPFDSDTPYENATRDSMTFPEIPANGSYFDVEVVMVTDPNNFIVQPLETAKKFCEFALDMQTFYNTEENLIKMRPKWLKVNNCYAVLYSDGIWYRVLLLQILRHDPANPELTVYFCDYGDCQMVSVENLQFLCNQFQDFPVQAIRASLSGIEPIQHTWEPGHCAEFRELINRKRFVSQIVDQRTVEENSILSIALELKLIDTSQPLIDVHIDQCLVNKNIARFT